MIMLAIPMVPIAGAGVPRPGQIIIVTYGEPETADPAWLYDTASAVLVEHVFEPLIFFNVTRDTSIAAPYLVDPKTAGQTGEFVPAIASSWTVEDITETSPEGLDWVQRVTFTIRSGVQFHEGGTVTTEDVEYSFERWMVQCRSGGPTWMILEPTLGTYSTRGLTLPDNATEAALLGKKIDHAVESNSTHVWFNLVMKYAPLNAILAQSWAGILSYDWQTAIDDWPGTGVTFANRWNVTYQDWLNWNNPDISPIDEAYSNLGVKPTGAGAFKFDYWQKGVAWQISQHVNYYKGWPAPINAGEVGAALVDRLPDNVTVVTNKFIDEWATRKMMFLSGDADFCAINRQNIPEIIYNYPATVEEYPSGITCFKDLPTLVCSPCLFYTYNVSTTSPFLGVAGGLPLSTLSEGGIPPDFFMDVDVRNAFSYCVNYTKYIEEIYMSEAALCPTPIIEGLPYHNASKTAPWFPDGDLAAAKTHFQAAWGGDLWTNGFTIGLSYNTGNTARQKACEMLKTAIESGAIGNAKFHVVVYGVDWPTFLGHLYEGELTSFVLGWLADFPDAHNFAMPFMHTYGDFGGFQLIEYGQSGMKQIAYTAGGVSYGNPALVIDNAYVDEMIENGIGALDAERAIIYDFLQDIYIAENPGVPLCKPVGRHWERTWITGWYYNPIYPGVGYYYHMYKETPTTWLPVDFSATDTIANLTIVNPIVQAYEGEMRLGGDQVTVTYNLTVSRVDTYGTPAIVHAGIALMRNNMTDTEYCIDHVVIADDTVGFGLGPDSVAVTIMWNETVVETDFESGIWNASGRVYVIGESEYDENSVNDEVFDVYLVEAMDLPGDVDGTGEVDIFDAVIFSGHFGGGPDNPDLYDSLCDLNGDGEIDIFDAIILAGNFGKTVPP